MKLLHSYHSERKLMGRLNHGSDLLGELTELVTREKINTGTFSVIGAVKKGAISYYNQESKEYKTMTFNEHLEILSCTGNISLKDGQPFIHCHIIFGDSTGKCLGGHLAKGTEIFAGELYLEELVGPVLSRSYDDTTGLGLWS
ncbi:MAG: PPC domain-containing DNA-binding protein [Bacillota bacterium]|jgi:predicted DNA-binding protein with PD1-like motif|nr:DNA-binding protein [Clostridia bacterium]